jgi:MFS family permease
VLAIASLGQFLGSVLATVVGVIIPLMQIVSHPELSSVMQGLVGCVSLIGIMVGASVFGPLTDRYGYLLFYRLCPAIVAAASFAAWLIHPLPLLILFLFLAGFGIGGEYSLDSEYITGIMPDRWKLFMTGVAKATCALGNVLAAVICFLLLQNHDAAYHWSALLLIVSMIALIMIILRIFSYESPSWLMSHNKADKAQQVINSLLGNDVVITPSDIQRGVKSNVSFADMFKGENLKRVIFCGIPWACEGLGVYGIGIFLPILCLSLGLEKTFTGEGIYSRLESISSSVEITALINFFIIPGFILGLLLIRRLWHVKMQTYGFLISAAGLILLLFAYRCGWSRYWSLAGFMIFEIALNAGPHLLTFILPAQIYPITDRGEGSGLAASFGKAGAVLGVFIIPILLDWGGAATVLIVSAAVMIIGAFFTGFFGRMVLPRTNNMVKLNI